MVMVDTLKRLVAGNHISGTSAGVIMALLAVVAGTLFQVRPPEAYGICMACHGRDMVSALLNQQFGLNMPLAEASRLFPLLTPIGVLIGAWLAAILSGEFRWRIPDHPLRTFIYGILVMNFALIAAGCSIRLLLRASAGEIVGAAGFGALAIGVISSTIGLRWKARQ